MDRSEQTQRVGEMSSFRRLLSRLEERQAWERANPVLAAAWNDAMREDDERTRRKEWEALQARLSLDMPLHLTRLGVQPKHAHAMRVQLEARPTLRAARRYLAQPKPVAFPVLFLAGKTDTGKTQAGVAVVADWVRNNAGTPRATGSAHLDAVYAKAEEVAAISRFDNADTLERYKRCPLLVLDDLGTEVATGPGASILLGIVDARYGAGRRTVVTTNLGPKELQRDYDERLLRRLRTDSICLVGGTLFEGGRKVESFGDDGRKSLTGREEVRP